VKASVEAIEEQLPTRLALSGGSSPREVYEALSFGRKINWKEVELFLVDERYTSLESEASNYKMIQDTLVSKLQGLKAFHYFDTSLPIHEALTKYEEGLPK